VFNAILSAVLALGPNFLNVIVVNKTFIYIIQHALLNAQMIPELMLNQSHKNVNRAFRYVKLVADLHQPNATVALVITIST